MKFILNIITVWGIGILILVSGNVNAGTRIIGIDGGMDPPRDENNQPQDRTDNDIANTNLIRSLIEAIRRYRPATEDQMVDSYDALDALLDNFTCECGDTIFFVFSGHGLREGIGFSKEEDRGKRIYDYSEIARKLLRANKECCCKIYFLIEACYSGSALDHLLSDEHVKGVYSSTTRDTVSTYNRDSTKVTGGWLKRFIDELDEIRLKVNGELPENLDDAIKRALGKAKDRTPVDAWHDGEQPQAFRRDTTVIYGHVRELFEDRFGLYYMVVEVHDPYWRRGQLDTIFLEDDEDFEKFRKCKWVKTEIVYEDLYGDRTQTGPITEAENVKDQLITAHVMEVRSGKVKVHVSWPRHMYCREIWLKNPPDKYVKPERELPKVPKPNRRNREERKRIKEEIKRIKEEIKEQKREYRKNARHRKLSVCRWVQQDINITDPTASGEAVKPLRPFGRTLGGLFHVKYVDRKKGTIRVGSRSGWIKRYRYKDMKIPDSTLTHLDTLFKDKKGRTRPIKYCDNIWITFWLPGSRDSMPEIIDAERVLPNDLNRSEQTSLMDPTIIQTNNSTMVMPEINIINNDETTYDARLHLNIIESKLENTTFDDSLTALVYLMSSADMEMSPTENSEQIMVDILPPASCQDWISNRLLSPKKTLENMQKDFYSIFRAFYLQKYMARSNDENSTQSMNTWINAYSSTTITPPENNSNSQASNNQRWISLQNNYPTNYQNQNQFNRAYLHSVLKCNSEPIGHELESVWNNVKSEVSNSESANINSSNNFRSYLHNYLQSQLMSNHGNVDVNDADCLQKVADYLTNLALTNSKLFAEATPSLSSLRLGQTINETSVKNSSKNNSTQTSTMASSYQTDILGLPEAEQEQVRFESVQLKAGKKYTAQYWRGDRISDEDNKSMNEADLNYEGQEVLSITFFIEEDNECACPDPNVLQTQAHATGEMTGIVYILHVVNTGESTALCNVGPYLAPGNAKTQTLFLPERHQVSLLPGEEIFIPLQGYCLDHHLLPPSDGTIVDPSRDWINLSTGSLSTSPDMNFFSNNLQQTKNRFSTTTNRNLLYPGHDTPLIWKYTDIKSVPELERVEYFQQLAFLNNQVLSITNRVYDNLYYNDQLNTPIGNTGYAQKELLQQQILWKFNSTLQNNAYTFDLFQEKAMKEIKQELPKSEYKTNAQKAAIEKGLREIWDQTELIGLKAKLWK